MNNLLQVTGMTASYGPSQVLFGIDFAIRTREVTTLLGRNGMGKTTTVRGILGQIRADAQRLLFRDIDISVMPTYKRARLGIGLVPEGRQIFPNLSVAENLVAMASNYSGSEDPWTLKKVFELFPRLAERQSNMGNQLSGGEQQMVAIGRALMTNPFLLVLDEATEGLAPVIRQEIWQCLSRLKQMGQAILLIDKNIEHVIAISDRHYILEKGRVVWTGSSSDLQREQSIRNQYLAI